MVSMVFILFSFVSCSLLSMPDFTKPDCLLSTLQFRKVSLPPWGGLSAPLGPLDFQNLRVAQFDPRVVAVSGRLELDNHFVGIDVDKRAPNLANPSRSQDIEIVQKTLFSVFDVVSNVGNHDSFLCGFFLIYRHYTNLFLNVEQKVSLHFRKVHGNAILVPIELLQISCQFAYYFILLLVRYLLARNLTVF